MRTDAAKSAIRYEMPALAASHQTSAIDLSGLSDEELEELQRLKDKLLGVSADEDDVTV